MKLLDVAGVNLFDLLKHEYLVLTEPTVRKLEGLRQMSGKDIYSILRRPVITEKAALLKEDNNQVVLRVRADANKIEIREHGKAHGRTVTNVNTSIQRGRRAAWVATWVAQLEKAVVTLEAGETVEFYKRSRISMNRDSR